MRRVASALCLVAVAGLLGGVAPARAQQWEGDGPPETTQAEPWEVTRVEETSHAEPTWLHKLADVAIARPVKAVRLVASAGFFPLALPVAALLGDPDWAFEMCLSDPADELFQRPLGEL